MSTVLAELYERHLEALQVARKDQRELVRSTHASGTGRATGPGSATGPTGGGAAGAAAPMRAQLDDIEAEITYLLLRERRPSTVVEIGALHGWSTSWILRALADNGCGHLHTFDRIDEAVRRVPPELSAGRWTFVPGDVRRTVGRIPAEVDHLFVDAAHTGRFARWYLSRVLPAVPPGTQVSVHDVFHRRTPLPWSEGGVLLTWLSSRGTPWFTVAPRRAPDLYEQVVRLRDRLGLTDPIRPGTTNPMLFFVT